MKIYTKGGDDGTTSLYGGNRVLKDDIRIESYGTIDELNSFIGLLCASLKDDNEVSFLLMIQNKLFDIGSILASFPGSNLKIPEVTEQDVLKLENRIDDHSAHLKPLKTFILPGGSTEISYAHICRTICRRAERRCISLHHEEYVPPIIIKYLNRLSDYFFILSRLIAKNQGHNDIPWVAEI